MPWCGRSWLKYVVYSLTTCSKCLPSWMRIWSRHSLRKLLINLSQIPFAWGVRNGVFNSLMPALTAKKCVAYFLSRSRIKYFGPFPHGVASRSCCAVHSSVGYFVTPVYIIRRVFSSITTNICHCRNSQSFTTVKSHAQIPRLDSSRKSLKFGLKNTIFSLSACISGRCVYSLLSPVLAILLGSAPLPIIDSLSPSSLSARSFQQ